MKSWPSGVARWPGGRGGGCARGESHVPAGFEASRCLDSRWTSAVACPCGGAGGSRRSRRAEVAGRFQCVISVRLGVARALTGRVSGRRTCGRGLVFLGRVSMSAAIRSFNALARSSRSRAVEGVCDLAAARDGPGDRMKLLDHGSRERGGMVPGAPPQVREVPVAREAVRRKSANGVVRHSSGFSASRARFPNPAVDSTAPHSLKRRGAPPDPRRCGIRARARAVSCRS